MATIFTLHAVVAWYSMELLYSGHRWVGCSSYKNHEKCQLSKSNTNAQFHLSVSVADFILYIICTYFIVTSTIMKHTIRQCWIKCQQLYKEKKHRHPHLS